MLRQWFLITLNVVLFLRVLTYSWVTDDAMITFRSVINFVNGNGICFNIGERVQSFTHPLWFLLLSVGALLNLNLYFFAIFLGLVLTVLFQYVFYLFYKKTGEFAGYTCAIILLGFSESFVQWQTSGLETSLTNVLLITFIYAMLFLPKGENRTILLGLLAAGILLNRLDHIFFLLFPLLAISMDTGISRRKFITIILVTFLPLFLWHAFSLMYFGALFPNTKYAKVGGRELSESLTHGARYFIEFLQIELWIIIPIAVLCYTLFCRTTSLSRHDRNNLVALAMGIVTFSAYVIYVGGDFMRGRFFDSVVVISAVIMPSILSTISRRWVKIAFCVMAVLIAPYTSFVARTEALWLKFPGMENERNFYKDFLGLNLQPNMNYTQHPWAAWAQEANKKYNGQRVTLLGVNGMRAYFCDPNISLIDPIGLTDAFVARTPVLDSTRTGHYIRKIPQEYLDERIKGLVSNNWESREMQDLWHHINIVQSSPDLFTVERLNSILWLWRNYGL